MDTASTPHRRLLMIVTSNPRTSGRMAEAIRFTAGVSAWQKVNVTLYVGGDAVQGLLAGDDQFVDEESIVDFLPLIAEQKQELFVESGHPVVAQNPNSILFPELNVKELAALCAKHDFVMRF